MEEVCFEKINGKNVFTIKSRSKVDLKRVVIMSHGFRGNSLGPARQFVDFSRLLLDNQISTLRFDQPNSGNSEGDYLDSSFNEWVNTTTYFAKRFLDDGYQVALLGQSMGATTSVIVSADKELLGRIFCLLLWVPDPKMTFRGSSDEVFEEGGQKYKGNFWNEARGANFLQCLDQFNGNIHLVYGTRDRYVSKENRDKVVKAVKKKGGQITILPGQDHSPWKYDLIHNVYGEELNLLLDSFS